MIGEILYELDELQSCFEAVEDLLCPEPELQAQQMDHISTLLSHLNRERELLTNRLRAEIGKKAELKVVS
ncbi:MAG: hypothetical protein V9G63_16225 [Candidatus Competibacter sp.]|jgi:hypothetical protein|nr:hypothetical protein [Candidatus Competibacteraceae bacterium]